MLSQCSVNEMQEHLIDCKNGCFYAQKVSLRRNKSTKRIHNIIMLSLLLYLSVQEFSISVARIYFIVTFVSGMFNNTKKHWLSIYVDCISSSEAILYSDQIYLTLQLTKNKTSCKTRQKASKCTKKYPHFSHIVSKSVCCHDLPVWRTSLPNWEPSLIYRCPTLGLPLGGSTTLHRYFIPTKFHRNVSSGSWGKIENANSLLHVAFF